MSFRLLAEDEVALVQALDLRQPLICGYSDGGQVALEIGMRYPDVGVVATGRSLGGVSVPLGQTEQATCWSPLR